MTAPAAGVDVLAGPPALHFAWRTAPSGRGDRPMIVAMHGSDRDHLSICDALADIAARLDANLLAPHFPAGAITRDSTEGYKFLVEPGADYAAILDAMLTDFAARQAFSRRALYLFGFSGGAQFVHRYAIVAASKLAGLVVAAPGNVTLIDAALPWWAGTGGIEAVTGRAVDLTGLEGLRAHFIVGGDDWAEGLVARPPGDPFHCPAGERAGPDRQSRIAALADSFAAHGASVTSETLPGVGHELGPIAAAAGRQLQRWIG